MLVKSVTIMGLAIMVNIDKIAIMAFLTRLHMAMNRTNIGVYANNRTNVDPKRKRN